MKIEDNKAKKQVRKVWSKPRLISGKEIGFFGLGNVQTTPYTDFS